MTGRRSHDQPAGIDYGIPLAKHEAMTSGTRSSTRVYRSSLREAQARRTRRSVLEAASSVFLAQGYAGATMRAIATRGGVSVPTLELLFGTKARLLKAAVDVAIAGDDEAVPVLERAWTTNATNATSVDELLAIVARVLAPAQARSAGLVLAVFEGAATDAELAELTGQMTAQRTTTAGWIVDAVSRHGPLRHESSRCEAIETLLVLMDPAVFDRLVRQRGWPLEQYQRWFARSAKRLLTADDPVPRSRRRPM